MCKLHVLLKFVVKYEDSSGLLGHCHSLFLLHNYASSGLAIESLQQFVTLSGSGKSYLAKMLRDLEVENGGNAPRIHSIDDYFMTEVEKVFVFSTS